MLCRWLGRQMDGVRVGGGHAGVEGGWGLKLVEEMERKSNTGWKSKNTTAISILARVEGI